MKKSHLLLLFIFAISTIYAQPSTDYAVQTWADVESDPAKITINWMPVNGAENYEIYRKAVGDTNWGASLGSFDNSVTSYEDQDVSVGVSYEYRVSKTGNVNGFGYINAGIEISADHVRGNMLLLVDNTFTETLAIEIEQLVSDLTGDGWTVYREDVDREGTVADIKEIVVGRYNSVTDNLDAVFCLGHVPVPYSGNYAPDGHVNNHEGAWPSDSYYGEIDGIWTDATADNTTASQERTHNVPGDGKFDQTFLPSDVEMQVGRVDFANMPAFSATEEELLRRYLAKNHSFKMGEIQAQMKAVIDDNFGGFNGEAFGSSAWKNFGPLLHPENVKSDDYRTSMDTASYIWSYGCGGGSYTSCSGVGTTSNLATDSLQGVFSSLFGSYFGDWDSNNNLLRATLAQGNILTNCWSGRPHWYFHHMGLGKNIGYSTKVSMNNFGTTYNTPLTFLARLTSMGLMGDPSLKMYILSPASELTADFTGFNTELSWTASTDSEVDYYIYRRAESDESYVLLNEEPVSETSFMDICVESAGTYNYMVRSTKLVTTPSGSFHNLSQGIFASTEVILQLPVATFVPTIMAGEVMLENTSINANAWLWDFGDNTTDTEFEPTHSYTDNGDYTISLTASNQCFQDESMVEVSIVVTALRDLIADAGISLSPNPVLDNFKLYSAAPMSHADVMIYDAFGTLLKTTKWNEGKISLTNDSELFPCGIYFVKILVDNQSGILKFVKI
ncbi:PKD domain-containing protein [Saprospiraceae bacterium]|nr:PKD domain-containing protein [Saprospiraceae bacterium]